MYSNEIASDQTFQQLKQLGFYLYYNPTVNIQHIRLLDHLGDIINAANCWLAGSFELDLNAQARLVNINRFADSIRRRGSCKPMILNWPGELPYEAGNGGTRMLAIEVVPEITTVPAFITSLSRQPLEEVDNLRQLRQLCQCLEGDVYIKLDNQVGVAWFEAPSQDPDLVVYSDADTAQALNQYIKRHSLSEFNKSWFATPIDWLQYFV